MAELLLKLDDLAVHFAVAAPLQAADVTEGDDGGGLRSPAGKPWWANRAAASPPWRWPSCGLIRPRMAGIALNGQAISRANRMGRAGRTVQMVFQDPYLSLNPRQTVRRIARRAAAGA